MSTLSQSPPPVRAGIARLCLAIARSGETVPDIYNLRRVGVRSWRLTKASGERAGVRYLVEKSAGVVTCTCPDSSLRGASCKHARAVVAAGLLSATPARHRKAVANG